MDQQDHWITELREEQCVDDQPDQSHQQGEDEENVVYIHHTIDGFPFPEDVEPYHDYRPGGFCPVHLGTNITERFKVVHKLGSGGYATVWLCRDLENERWVAVKILAARNSRDTCPEFHALQVLGGSDIDYDELERNHIFLPQEHFYLDSDNGRHVCFVMPWLGPQLRSLAATFTCNPTLLKDLTFQICEAIKFLHGKNLCHGDFTPSNVLVKLRDDIHALTEDDVYDLLGFPDIIHIRSTRGEDAPLDPGVPDYLVIRKDMSPMLHYCTRSIAAIDFGVCYSIDDPPHQTGIPQGFESPEMALGSGAGFSSDLWSLILSIHEIRSGGSGSMLCGDDLRSWLTEVELLLGPVPEPYRSFLIKYHFPFAEYSEEEIQQAKEEGRLLPATKLFWDDEEEKEDPWKFRCAVQCARWGKLEDFAEEEAREAWMLPREGRYNDPNEDVEYRWKYKISEEEESQLKDLVKRGLRWFPEDRLSLDDIMAHKFFEGRKSGEPYLGVSLVHPIEGFAFREVPKTPREEIPEEEENGEPHEREQYPISERDEEQDGQGYDRYYEEYQEHHNLGDHREAQGYPEYVDAHTNQEALDRGDHSEHNKTVDQLEEHTEHEAADQHHSNEPASPEFQESQGQPPADTDAEDDDQCLPEAKRARLSDDEDEEESDVEMSRDAPVSNVAPKPAPAPVAQRPGTGHSTISRFWRFVFRRHSVS
jgi:serine/threonine protein kinase